MRLFLAAMILGGCASNAGSADGGVCRDGDERLQRYGATCLCCHGDEFGVAGSVQQAGSVARVVVVDANGSVADMVPNRFDNFFRHFAMTPPFRATVFDSEGRSASMAADAPSADCNGCHAPGGVVPPIHGPI